MGQLLRALVPFTTSGQIVRNFDSRRSCHLRISRTLLKEEKFQNLEGSSTGPP